MRDTHTLSSDLAVIELPVYDIEAELLAAHADPGAWVLSAPTGSGKTTQVPQMLLRAGAEGRIIVLQPRRLAARLVASRIADELGTDLGATVGFQTRHERQWCEATRILFLTEGLFLRWLQVDPRLDGIGTVLLDEFHERSLHADISLGLCRRLRETTRPDLRLGVMSATLDPAAVSAYLEAPVLRAEGRVYPVDIDYEPGETQAPVWERAADAARRWLDGAADGNALVFMPGAFEIRRTLDACRRRLLPSDGPVEVLPLYGSLSAEDQRRAVAPAENRKIIVATNVAETSITIEGVRCVIDAGLARVHRFDPNRGVNTLLIERISLASAEQRAGRAGRTAPGVCLRLWSRSEAHARPSRDTPEVARVDLSEAVLTLTQMGVNDPGDFPWIESPPLKRLQMATQLLRRLDAVDLNGALTPLGQQLARFPAHPRIGRLLLEGHGVGVTQRVALWAALIAERDICARPVQSRYSQPPARGLVSDLVMRERALLEARRLRFDSRRCGELGIHANACRDVDRAAHQYERLLRQCGEAGKRRGDDDEALLRALALAYPDHVAARRQVDQLPGDRLLCEMPGRRRVALDRTSVAVEADFLIAIETRETEAPRREGGGVHTVLSLATAVSAAQLEAWLGEHVVLERELQWNAETRAVEEVVSHSLLGLALRRSIGHPRDRAAAAAMIVERIRAGDLSLDHWDEGVENWLARARCVAAWYPERNLLVYDEEDLEVIMREIVGDDVRFGPVRKRRCLDYVRNAMSWNDQQLIERLAPEKLTLVSGHGMRISYTPGEPPRGRARIQDFYGMSQTPRVGGGRVSVLLEILAPNFRPAQVTDDLAGFWERTYPELKKELKRRYPKHEWR